MDNEKRIVLNREEFPSNSQKAKPQKPKVQKLVNAKRVKKPFHKRFKNAFLDGEPAHEVGQYVIYDVVIPAAKSTIADLIEGAIDLLLFGGQGRGRSRTPHVIRDRGRSYPNTPYNSMYDRNVSVPGHRGRNSRTHNAESGSIRGIDVSDIVFPSRAAAERVLDELIDTIAKYEAVSMSDFYDMAGISSPYTAQKWGWSDIDGASIVRVRDGWIIDLPNPIVIE
jgi:hypothetical protein